MPLSTPVLARYHSNCRMSRESKYTLHFTDYHPQYSLSAFVLPLPHNKVAFTHSLRLLQGIDKFSHRCKVLQKIKAESGQSHPHSPNSISDYMCCSTDWKTHLSLHGCRLSDILLYVPLLCTVSHGSLKTCFLSSLFTYYKDQSGNTAKGLAVPNPQSNKKIAITSHWIKCVGYFFFLC